MQRKTSFPTPLEVQLVLKKINEKKRISLNDIVKKEHFVLGSEYLKTLLVCVPKMYINEWYNKYETLCSMIVPRTTEFITEDQDYALFTVTLFQKTEDTFRHKCRENK